MKLLIIPKEKGKYSELADGYILPLESFSVGYELKYSIEEIQQALKNNREVFVVLNKNIFNHEIEDLQKTLIILNEMNVSGVLFYDLSVLSIVRRLHLSLALIWNQTHMVTNYNTINYYFSKGVKGALLSNEITLEEMLEIRQMTKSLLFANIIYRPIMSFSRRHLIHNYYKSSDLEDLSSNLLIHEKVSGEDLLVQEGDEGTVFFSKKIVNGLTALPNMIQNDFHYGIVDLSSLSEESGIVCLSAVRKILDGNGSEEDISRVSKLIGTYTGFLYKKTIYKVK